MTIKVTGDRRDTRRRRSEEKGASSVESSFQLFSAKRESVQQNEITGRGGRAKWNENSRGNGGARTRKIKLQPSFRVRLAHPRSSHSFSFPTLPSAVPARPRLFVPSGCIKSGSERKTDPCLRAECDWNQNAAMRPREGMGEKSEKRPIRKSTMYATSPQHRRIVLLFARPFRAQLTVERSRALGQWNVGLFTTCQCLKSG